MRHPALIVILSILSAGVVPAAPPTAYVIADNTTGTIIAGNNGAKKLPVGSLTKVATAMVVIDWSEATGNDLSQTATVPQSAMGLGAQPGVGFSAGDQCSLRDLLYAALLQSDNAAAQTLAHHVGNVLGGKGVEAFVKQMNALARQLTMTRTLFLNPHGLDDNMRAYPYSTAEDMAKLTSYAMKNPAFRFIVSQKERRITYTNTLGEETQYLLRNTNNLLGNHGIDGGKTGLTRRAGGCLVVSSVKPPISTKEADQVMITPRRLNVVVLGSEDRFGVTAALVERGWQEYERWAAEGRPAKWKGAK
jgi:D-alanyl-D-alanine carboxypeptidase (penicillin-binding protein 5/6)